MWKSEILLKKIRSSSSYKLDAITRYGSAPFSEGDDVPEIV